MTATQSTTSFVANVWDDDHQPIFKDWMDEAAHGRTVQGQTYFHPYIQLHDESDPEDGPLYLMYCQETGWGGTVFAPMCWAAEEMERRIVRCLGDLVCIDSVDIASTPDQPSY